MVMPQPIIQTALSAVNQFPHGVHYPINRRKERMTMGNEQMMICPKAKECGDRCAWPSHQIPHENMASSCNYCSGNRTGTSELGCPACIPVPSTPAKPKIKIKVCKGVVDNKEHIITVPVPSTPASVLLSPDELLKEIKELPEFIEYRDAIRTQHNHPFSIEYMRTFEAEDKLISAILLKCHQSEAAKIKQLELGKKLSMESDNRIEQAIGKVLGYPAYKDDQKNFPNATESNGVCVGDHVAESLVMELVDRFKAIRSDQNKKIAKALNDIGLWDSKSRMYQLIAKLQKGEF
jgi:hypothetical protein